MKKISSKALLVALMIGSSLHAFAGNKDRSGQAGAPELDINPWAQSTGVFGLNTAYIQGMEAMKNNIAGLAFVEKTDIGFSHGIYLSGSQVSINDLGVAQKVGNAGVLGLNIMSMSFGDITMTDYNNPDGIGTFHPQFLNIQLGYGKTFSNSIHAGVAATYVSEQINNISATGAAFDAGVQYTTGKRDNFHFGITLRNIGTNMRFTGTGFAISAESPQSTPQYSVTEQYPSDKFQMPTNLNIGAAYDFYLDENHSSGEDSMPKHKLTIMGDFTSNSFNNDYLGIGVEYTFHDILVLRAGYRYEKGIGNETTSTTMYTGIAGGITLQKRLSEKGPMLAIDYSYRPTQRPANGVHMFSIRFTRR